MRPNISPSRLVRLRIGLLCSIQGCRNFVGSAAATDHFAQLPLVFRCPEFYDRIAVVAHLELPAVLLQIARGDTSSQASIFFNSVGHLADGGLKIGRAWTVAVLSGWRRWAVWWG